MKKKYKTATIVLVTIIIIVMSIGPVMVAFETIFGK